METILSTLPSVNDTERVLVVLVRSHDSQDGEATYLEMRQQSWGEGVGWFTQNSLRLEPGQVADLRGVIGNVQSPLPRRYRQPQVGNWQPKVVQADSA